MKPLWDLPTRAFHWLLVMAVACSWISQEWDYYTIHQWSGFTVLVLVVFRIGWGLVGSQHSRFSDFVRGPRAVIAHFRGHGEQRPGHNAAGGWSILVLLSLLLAQALTGLFNSDELLYDGPFHHALDEAWTDRLGAWHETAFWALCAMMLLHILAIIYYQWIKHKKLIRAMITGGEGDSMPAPLWRAPALLLVLIGLLYLAIQMAPEPVLPW
jgi:cytochrome b